MGGQLPSEDDMKFGLVASFTVKPPSFCSRSMHLFGEKSGKADDWLRGWG